MTPFFIEGGSYSGIARRTPLQVVNKVLFFCYLCFVICAKFDYGYET